MSEVVTFSEDFFADPQADLVWGDPAGPVLLRTKTQDPVDITVVRNMVRSQDLPKELLLEQEVSHDVGGSGSLADG